jgi:ParB family chromosome partitioning protein
MNVLPITEIVIGPRVRRDMGDIESLAESIKRHGLLHPVVVKNDKTLVAGHRRIEAARQLGWETIPVTMIEVADLLSAERDENAERKDFTPTEAVAIGRLIEQEHRAKIEEQKHAQRVAAGLRSAAKRNGMEILPPVHGALGPARETAAKAVGMGAPKYTQAQEIVAAAEADPETFGDLPEKMDETGNVSGTHRELERRKGKPHRHAALKKLAYPKPNREMERAIDSLDGICICLRELPVKQLDTSKTKEWAKALKKAVTTIARVAREIERVKAD